MENSGSSIRFRLREATGPIHRVTERMFALDRRTASLEAYRDLLRSLHGFYAPMERRLSSLRWPRGVSIDRHLRKAVWLRQDLLVLGFDERMVDGLPECPDLPPLETAAQGFGALYVMEGATLGGQVILQALKNRLGLTPETGARFFSSYGAAIGAVWRDFVTLLDRQSGQGDEIEKSAAAVFRAFGAWLPPPTAAEALNV